MPENLSPWACPDYLALIRARDGKRFFDCLCGAITNDCGGDPSKCSLPDRWTPEALAALEAKEPMTPLDTYGPPRQGKTPARLITAEDFHSPLADDGGAIPAWKEARKPTHRSGWAVLVYGRWVQDKGAARYWTARPTDEQREGAAWD